MRAWHAHIRCASTECPSMSLSVTTSLIAILFRGSKNSLTPTLTPQEQRPITILNKQHHTSGYLLEASNAQGFSSPGPWAPARSPEASSTLSPCPLRTVEHVPIFSQHLWHLSSLSHAFHLSHYLSISFSDRSWHFGRVQRPSLSLLTLTPEQNMSLR